MSERKTNDEGAVKGRSHDSLVRQYDPSRLDEIRDHLKSRHYLDLAIEVENAKAAMMEMANELEIQ